MNEDRMPTKEDFPGRMREVAERWDEQGYGPGGLLQFLPSCMYYLAEISQLCRDKEDYEEISGCCNMAGAYLEIAIRRILGSKEDEIE